MQHYFNALARATFKDTRPQDIIELDTTLDAANLPRIWFATNSRGPSPDNLPELRKWKWHISIPYSTQTLYLAIADHYRITPKHPNPTPLIRTMAVLEAIGQQNLTPIDLPIATHKYPVRYDPNYPSRSWPSIAIYPAGGGPR
jgi:alpha-ketoglutarate-dependent taurine dioxygenase